MFCVSCRCVLEIEGELEGRVVDACIREAAENWRRERERERETETETDQTRVL